MSKDEVKLIQQAKQGDPAAFAKIYDRHQPAVYRYVLYRVADVATAEDLTGEVFVRMVEKIDRFTYRGRPLLSWLYTIARNLVADHYRQSETSPLEDHVFVSAASTPSLDETVERRLNQQRLIAAISRLTEDQRMVILLKFVEGFDNKSTAQMLGKSVLAVKALQHRALAALQRILESDEGLQITAI
jgi:RNA polymerase sigma-70 factor (ECF subfamily)